jgi:succinoglycan biosynthesis protein ExoO
MISVVIPAYGAQATIARAIRSVLEQTVEDWEAIIVADDDVDYAALLYRSGIEDPRLRFVSTGRSGSGCHNARNVGLTLAGGDFIAALDADDLFLTSRFEKLLPLTSGFGAAVDNPNVVDDTTCHELYRAFSIDSMLVALDVSTFLDTTVPLFPLVAREYVEPRLAGIDFGEDVVANLQLIDRLGSLPIIGESLSEYRVVRGSLCHSDGSAENFEQSYSDLIKRLSDGDQLGLKPANAAAARNGLLRKRYLNRAFAAARKDNHALDFQTFAAARRKSAVSV